MRLQHRFHHIGGIALHDAIQRHAHALEVQTHGVCRHFHRLPVHLLLRVHHGAFAGQLMLRLRFDPHLPQRLHGNIECACTAA